MATNNHSSDATGEYANQSLSRYDLLLAAVPVPLVTGAVTAATLGTPPVTNGLGVGAFVSTLIVLYGLFFAPPDA
jgi:hypothetical protein